MSIPGLGQFTTQTAAASTNRTITLHPFWEWRFEVPRSSPQGVTVRLTNGTAERDGTELALNKTYTFVRTKSKLVTYKGCTLEVSGETSSDSVVQYAHPEHSPLLSQLNVHFVLQDQRRVAGDAIKRQTAYHGHGHHHQPPPQGPRVMICGPGSSGKTTLARTLTALATRMGSQPLVASVDPGEGLLSLPGTMSAAVFGTLMDVEEPAGGFGVSSTPSSGPSAVPVKLPMVYYFGREKVSDDVPLWKDLTGKLASSVRAKLRENEDVRAAGLILDTPAVDVAKADSMKEGVEVLVHAVREFGIDIITVLGSEPLAAALQQALVNDKTALGEPITIVPLDKSDGVANRDKGWMQMTREMAIKEYFFGDAKRTLSPFTQSVSYDDIAIFRATTDDLGDEYGDDQQNVLEPADITPEMSHWTLAVMDASVNDPPETIRLAPVIGFIAIAEVDEDRRRLKFLSPVSGRLGNKPLVWASWPEPYINLLG